MHGSMGLFHVHICLVYLPWLFALILSGLERFFFVPWLGGFFISCFSFLSHMSLPILSIIP